MNAVIDNGMRPNSFPEKLSQIIQIITNKKNNIRFTDGNDRIILIIHGLVVEMKIIIE